MFDLKIIVFEFVLMIPFEFFWERYISHAFLDAPYSIIVFLVQVTEPSISIACEILTHRDMIPNRVQILKVIMLVFQERLLHEWLLIDIHGQLSLYFHLYILSVLLISMYVQVDQG